MSAFGPVYCDTAFTCLRWPLSAQNNRCEESWWSLASQVAKLGRDRCNPTHADLQDCPWSSGEEKSGPTRIADSNLDKYAQKSKTKRKGKRKREGSRINSNVV